MAKIRMNEVSGIALLLFVISIVIGLAVTQAVHNPAPAIFGALVGVYFLFAIKVVRQWEKVAVLRLGRYVGLRGPGLCHIIPIVETLSPYVDPRVPAAPSPGMWTPSSSGWSGTPRNPFSKSRTSSRPSR